VLDAELARFSGSCLLSRANELVERLLAVPTIQDAVAALDAPPTGPIGRIHVSDSLWRSLRRRESMLFG
jgi:hypothetical protein